MNSLSSYVWEEMPPKNEVENGAQSEDWVWIQGVREEMQDESTRSR
jgi:hypothetical protein